MKENYAKMQKFIKYFVQNCRNYSLLISKENFFNKNKETNLFDFHIHKLITVKM